MAPNLVLVLVFFAATLRMLPAPDQEWGLLVASAMLTWLLEATLLQEVTSLLAAALVEPIVNQAYLVPCHWCLGNASSTLGFSLRMSQHLHLGTLAIAYACGSRTIIIYHNSEGLVCYLSYCSLICSFLLSYPSKHTNWQQNLVMYFKLRA